MAVTVHPRLVFVPRFVSFNSRCSARALYYLSEQVFHDVISLVVLEALPFHFDFFYVGPLYQRFIISLGSAQLGSKCLSSRSSFERLVGFTFVPDP